MISVVCEPLTKGLKGLSDHEGLEFVRLNINLMDEDNEI